MKRGYSKRGQMKMSFGMIFSIILIVIFIAFAIFAITKFLNLQKSINTSQFITNMQSDVDNVYQSPQSNQPVSYNAPRSVVQACFTNSTSDNLLFFDKSGNIIPGGNIQDINLSYMTRNGDDCFNATNGKINFVLSKNFKENLVTIEG